MSLKQKAKLPSRLTLRKDINLKYETMVAVIKGGLKDAPYAAMTADIWSAHGKSYLGVTLHWITDLLERKSCAVACRRFKGVHSYDKIADMLSDIISEFQSKDSAKISHCSTDNGSNFVKTFSEFGLKHIADTDGSDSDSETQNTAQIDDTENKVEFIDLESVMNEIRDDPTLPRLPKHVRCASHTLALVAANVIEKPEIPLSFKRLYRSAMGKMAALWNLLNRSASKARETCESVVGRQLPSPVPTRWNSLYDCTKIALTVKVNLNELFGKLNLPPLKPYDIELLEEYVKIMTPVAIALDKLQSEKECFYGILMPTIMSAINNLKAVVLVVEHSEVFRNVIVEDIERRFTWLLDPLSYAARDALLAAISHPYFRLRFLPRDVRQDAKQIFIVAVRRFASVRLVSVSRSLSESSSTTAKCVDNFFNFEEDETDATPCEETPIDIETLHYLEDTSYELECLTKYPIIKRFFIKTNTPLPSSAPVERLFSVGGNVMTKKRTRLTDDRFEKLTLLKANKA